MVTGKVPMGAVGAPTVYGDRGGMVKIVGDKSVTASCSQATSYCA